MSRRKVPSDEILKELYLNQRLSSGQIAEKHNCARGSVCKHLRRLGITRPEEGENSRNRNFKTKQYRSGYPVTFLPKHPRANHLGYVFDHILTIEKNIGRIPTKTEMIHHIDFNRKNSKLENLYLCKSNRDHQILHSQVDEIVKKLIEKGLVGFENGRYFLKCFASETL